MKCSLSIAIVSTLITSTGFAADHAAKWSRPNASGGFRGAMSSSSSPDPHHVRVAVVRSHNTLRFRVKTDEPRTEMTNVGRIRETLVGPDGSVQMKVAFGGKSYARQVQSAVTKHLSGMRVDLARATSIGYYRFSPDGDLTIRSRSRIRFGHANGSTLLGKVGAFLFNRTSAGKTFAQQATFKLTQQ